jgi:hypothetical protein
MVTMLRPLRAALLSAALLLPALPTHAQPAPAADLEPSMEVMKSFGCLATGTTGTLAAIGFGPENLVNLVSGGIVTPANSAVLAIGVVGVVFASFCTVGESLTPSVLYMMDHTAPVVLHIGRYTAEAASAGLDTVATAARATQATITETLAPALAGAAEATIATAAAGLDSATTAAHRLATAALETATDAIEAATTLAASAPLSPTAWAPSAWVDAGWNALATICLQSPLCRARVTDAPTAPSNIAAR